LSGIGVPNEIGVGVKADTIGVLVVACVQVVVDELQLVDVIQLSNYGKTGETCGASFNPV
jgi:hypothetical protein